MQWISTAQYDEIRARRSPFSDVLATVEFAGEVDGRSLFGQTVSGNYFGMLGVGMERGRPLLPDDAGSVMVLSDEAWRNKFGGDPEIVGRKVYLRGHPFEVVGVTNAAFTGLESFPVGFWIPMRGAGPVTDGSRRISVIGRLAPGVSPEAAKSEMLAWARGVSKDAVGVNLEPRATSVPVTKESVLQFLPIFVAFGLVLLIACANVSNMMLARALARQREVAIRMSLGAGRARLVRQFLTESVILAIPAALAGVLIAEATLEGARRLLFATIPPTLGRILAIADLTPDWRVFGFVLAASVGTGLVFGLAPAIQTTRSRIVEANRGDFSSDYRPARLRNVLVVVQVAVCSLLLVFTAIVLRSERRVMDRQTGLDTRGVWDITALEKYHGKIAARLAAMPDAEAVAAVWLPPLYGALRKISVMPSGGRESVGVGYDFVSEGYFAVFRIPLLRGRLFTKAEADAEAPVVVISERTAKRLWPGREALGETVAILVATRTDPYLDRAPAYTSARVVGVVRDAKAGFLGDDPEETCLYFPTNARAPHNNSVMVRLNGETGSARRRLAAALDEVAPSVADFINPMDDIVALQVYPFRVVFWIAGFLGGVALLMTVSGIYGVMAYLVSQRTKEIGIRVALGAGAWDVVRMVVRQSTMLAGVGAAVGAGLALAIAPVFAHHLDAIRPYEAGPYLVTMAVVLAAAVAASWAPSKRAVGIDPVTTLRCD
jgi:predicted permease